MSEAAFPIADSPEHEAAARAHYEAGRRRVSGRPAWRDLNPHCPYDLGMIEHAYAEGRRVMAAKAAPVQPRRGLGGPLFGSRRPA
ncbi:hypothetical protein ABID82_004275 [Methylobacterium sp. PvP062]|mgnify:CR=1 FL=1|uniref:Uncharacterized protein n=1 Tax=Methylobacterium radiotolerans TaxID=31998 RepID=A0ABV2NL51_9HYPH|nr:MULTISPECIES: hypothetical protein [unclassified Methylobacterium]KZC01439.1 hypothetical protein AU375_02363 [Methylobacterium radiotolerans]MBP2496037.1 hypothetical protein [Methylobacterium sp. PvP105]MBP2504092.1 hypothetical protein [Methylobacterium sp. PvP109]MCX7333117.1 hypothetical protein [Hyphomicrobiales bacterium]